MPRSQNKSNGSMRRLFSFLLHYQHWRCYLCGRRMEVDDVRPHMRATFEHVIPKSKAKGLHGNKLLACSRCNHFWGDEMPTACEKMYAAEAWRAYCGVAQ